MADGFEPYHVPQQSRRDKLRGSSQPGCVDNLQGCAALLPLYDPSLISSDLINSAAANLHRQGFSVGGAITGAAAKEEGVNLMGFVGGLNASHLFVDPQLSAQLNPNMTIQKISGSTCLYPADIPSTQCYGGAVDQSFHGNEVVAYKPQALSAAHQEPNSNSAATNGQILSLSLSSQHGNLPLELNLQRYDSTVFKNSKVNGGCVVACNNGGSTSVDLSKSSVPLGPFTGYASVLKGSRFLKPAQQLLEELCDVGRGISGEKSGAESSLLDSPPLEALDENGIVDDSVTYSQGVEQSRKKSKLLSMLDEVYKRYKQYYQQMQGAVAAFESVAGLSSAAPFANWALKAMSKHFICLKNAIADQLHSTSKSHSKIDCDRDETQRLENSRSGTYGQRPFQNAGLANPPIWRPQRGLPDRAVAVLRAWLFEHFLHPYPTDTDKLMLAKQTGLSRNQVSNWFINARVRLWKPMVEEIHVLETRQSQKASQREEHPPDGPNDHCPVNYSIELENASTSVHRFGELPSKRTREDPTGTPGGSEGPLTLQYDNVLCNPHLGAGLSNAVGIGSGSVSLTLGLHQNGGGLPDLCPMNAARRLGLDSHGEGGYMASGFAAQSRQLGRDVVNGQLMHDFVG